jgi:hypothetical protein
VDRNLKWKIMPLALLDPRAVYSAIDLKKKSIPACRLGPMEREIFGRVCIRRAKPFDCRVRKLAISAKLSSRVAALRSESSLGVFDIFDSFDF